MSAAHGVVYTEYSTLRATSPIASLWSFTTLAGEPARPLVAMNRDGHTEYWLERSDPLLNTILPGTAVSVVLNLGERWAAGHTSATCSSLPRICVIGPFTTKRILRVGAHVRAVGAAVPSMLTMSLLGVPASELIDRIVPLDDLWPPPLVAGLADASAAPLMWQAVRLRDALLARLWQPTDRDPLAESAGRSIVRHRGRASIGALARQHGLSRQQLARRFSLATGMTPKLFARVTRFQALIPALLSTDVAQWASVADAIGFYDQAHMINDFRSFAGAPPTEFFQPHGGPIEGARIRLRGRPSEWLRAETEHDSEGRARVICQ